MPRSASHESKRMNAGRFFVDTNLILYTYDQSNRQKQERAEAWMQWLWANTAGCLSWQVLQEFYWNAVRKFDATPARVRQHIAVLCEWGPPDVTLTLLERAWFWSDSAQITFWDAMVVAAAERTHCRWLLSEDFQPGRAFGSITVLNPFDRSPGDEVSRS
jgi:predicted nucleic acid-binding protein